MNTKRFPVEERDGRLFFRERRPRSDRPLARMVWGLWRHRSHGLNVLRSF